METFMQELVEKIVGQASSLVVMIVLALLIIWLINKPLPFLNNRSIWQIVRGSLVDEFKVELDEIRESITTVNTKLDNHIAKSEERQIKKCRLDILDFNEEILLGLDHTKEHYEEILDMIKRYNDYCAKHPDFPNNKCVLACENIEETFKMLEREVTKKNMKKKNTVNKAVKNVKNSKKTRVELSK